MRWRSAAIIVVQPGEKVPIDGVVMDGASSLNTSALTGESLPRDVERGRRDHQRLHQHDGRAEDPDDEGVRRIYRVQNSGAGGKFQLATSPAPRDFISKFASVYTPAVCYGALALAVLPPLVRMLFMGLTRSGATWIYRALTFLVISCPCALVISIPLSFFAGIGGASKEGVLIKGSNYLETLSQTKTVVFDKTGTLTQGVFEVNGVHHSQMEEEKLLEYAALAECASSHPISKSLQKAYGRADRPQPRNGHSGAQRQGHLSPRWTA